MRRGLLDIDRRADGSWVCRVQAADGTIFRGEGASSWTAHDAALFELASYERRTALAPEVPF